MKCVYLLCFFILSPLSAMENAKGDDPELYNAVKQGESKKVMHWFSYGEKQNPNYKDGVGMSLLEMAMDNHDSSMVAVLLESGSSVSAGSPLEYMLDNTHDYENGWKESDAIIELLLAHKADSSILEQKYKEFPEWIAARKSNAKNA